jgi:hypothetical protein
MYLAWYFFGTFTNALIGRVTKSAAAFQSMKWRPMLKLKLKSSKAVS